MTALLAILYQDGQTIIGAGLLIMVCAIIITLAVCKLRGKL
jgi:hypothetical protein